MTESLESYWYQNNLNFIFAEVERILNILDRHISGEATAEPSIASNNWSGSLLENLCKKLNLSNFEKEVLLLCLSVELNPKITSLCQKIQGSGKNYPTIDLALSCFDPTSFQVISHNYPLLKWKLIEIEPDLNLTSAPIRIDKRILSYLLGISDIDKELIGLVRPFPDELKASTLTQSQLNIVDNMVNTWSNGTYKNKPILQLCGSEIHSKYAISHQVTQKLNTNLFILSVNTLPLVPRELEWLKIKLEREAILSNSVLLLDLDEIEGVNKSVESVISSFIETLDVPLIINSYERRSTRYRPIIYFDAPSLSYEESKSLWSTYLGDISTQLNGQLDRIASQFNLSPHGIEATFYSVLVNEKKGHSLSDSLWNSCRTSARPKLDNLAQRIESDASWDDLIIPEQEKDLLKDLVVQVKQKTKVYEQWGFGGKKRGLGITALFHGSSGTGKTMAAEVIANTLNLDLYRIDLSSVVSKYIGETEKNLRKIFDAAESGGAVLLFDEADAIFGKRTEVKDSHDRHANIEVSYLLQRMEAYQGLAILTTNLKQNMDGAFLRRIRFIVKFEFPDAEQRIKIWQNTFPTQTPTDGLNFEKLAKFSSTGADIKNIAMNAAFLAAEAKEPVMMKHLLEAARKENAKLDYRYSDKGFEGWVEKK